MGKAYFENRDYLIPYEKVDRVAIRDSVAEVHTLSYSKPPVLRNEDAEAFMKGLRAYLEGQPIETGAPKKSKASPVSFCTYRAYSACGWRVFPRLQRFN